MSIHLKPLYQNHKFYQIYDKVLPTKSSEEISKSSLTHICIYNIYNIYVYDIYNIYIYIHTCICIYMLSVLKERVNNIFY